MKKFLLGLVVGLILATASSVYAEEISKVGKKITTEFVVKLNGEALPVKAIAFEGTSYAPIRVVSEALGLDVDFKNDEVLLTTISEVEEAVAERLSKEEFEKVLVELEDQMKIDGMQLSIHKYSIEQANLNPESNTEERQKFLDRITELESKIANAEQAIADLKAQYPEYAE